MSQSKMFERRKLANAKRQANVGVDGFQTDRGLDIEKVDTDDVRLASDKVASDIKSQGRYATLIQTTGNRLKIIPNPTTIKEFSTDNAYHFHENILTALNLEADPTRKHNVLWSDDTILIELLDDLTSNGWMWLDPANIGALTSAPILEAPDGRVYWHERYAIEAAGEDLLLGKTVAFDGAPENRPLRDPNELLPEEPAAVIDPAVKKSSSDKTATFRVELHAQGAIVRDKKFGDKAKAEKYFEEQRDAFMGEKGTKVYLSEKEGSEWITLKTAGSQKTADDVAAAVADIPAPAPAPAPVDAAPAPTGSGKYKYWTAEALSSVIEALSKVSDFTNDKAAQQAVAEMAEELNSRPKAVPEAPKTASLTDDTKKLIDYAVQGLYKFQMDGEQDTQLVAKSLQSLHNVLVETGGLSPEGKRNLTDAIRELESFDEGTGGDLARAIVSLEDITGDNWSTKEANMTGGVGGGFTVNEDTGVVLEGDKSIPSGHDDVEDNTGIVRPKTTTPSKVALLVNEDTSKVLEGDKSIPDGRDKVEDNTGITRPKTDSPRKFAAAQAAVKTARDVHQETEIDGVTYILDTWQERDRLHISLRDETNDKDVLDLWDEDAYAAVEDGFIDPRNYLGSAIEYATQMGMLNKPATSAPDLSQPGKTSAEISTAKALKMTEDLGEKLKSLYLDAKPLTGVNGTRPVRDAVEAIYQAMALFGEATKTLTKQVKQETEEEVAATAAVTKKKSSLMGGLKLAADSDDAEEESAAAEE